jgi:phage shock protein C
MNQHRRITRSTDDRMIAGVCGGLAAHFGWPSTRLRIAYVLLSIISAAFPGLFVYAVLWYLIPEAPREPREFRVRPPGQ